MRGGLVHADKRELLGHPDQCGGHGEQGGGHGLFVGHRTRATTARPESVTVSTTPASLDRGYLQWIEQPRRRPPGTYTVSTVNDTNYQGTATGTLVVGKVALVVAAQGMTRCYGGTNAPFTAVVDGFVNGENLSNLSGSLVFTVEDTNNTVVSVDTNTPAGTYTIIPGGLSSSDYTITYSNASLLIMPAILTVTADSLTNVYGSPLPALTWSYQGFVNGEDTNVLSGAPSLSTNLSSGSPVAGSPYTITITNGTLSASNYVFTNYSGTLTVLPAPLAVSADSTTNVYGSPMPALTGSMSGVTNNDPLSVTFTMPVSARHLKRWRQIVAVDHAILGQDHRALDHVFKFAHIARPIGRPSACEDARRRNALHILCQSWSRTAPRSSPRAG